jgi:hypothetical protein
MAGLMSAEEIFEKTQAAAVAATSPDEKALQIDYPSLREKIRAALGDRKVARCHLNRFLPEGYEEQGRFNVLLLTAGNVLFDMVIGDTYFRYDVVSVAQLDKVQVIDAMWDNKEKRREEPFLSLRLILTRRTRNEWSWTCGFKMEARAPSRVGDFLRARRSVPCRAC